MMSVFYGRDYCPAVSWFKHSQQLSITQTLAHFSLGGMTERIRRIKVRKLMG